VLGLVFGSAASRQHVALVEKSKRDAEARAEELEMFAGRVAHDLRAPLSVIQMQSGSAQRATTVESMRHAVERLVRQGARMAEIIDALLAFARAGAPPEDGVADVADVVGEVVAENRLIASGSKIDIVLEAIPHGKVAASHGVLDIILTNLVRNAVKYIGDGQNGVRRISVRARELHGMVRFEVEDTGPGLPPGSERAVFEPFVRAAKTSASGIGLGLATVKRLVEAHHGRVGVESRPDRGSRFWFDLPRASERAASGPRERRMPATRRDASDRRWVRRDPWA
jgi:signal transduction histidine kinase